MSEARDLPSRASLAFLTQPAPGIVLLNLQMVRDGPLMRVEISRSQLANIVVEGVGMALRPVPAFIQFDGPLSDADAARLRAAWETAAPGAILMMESNVSCETLESNT